MSWVQTYTSKKFDVMNPKPENISIIDIAHSLSLQCRFNGHCRAFYSVGEHCVRASMKEADPELALILLLHDASEAYLCDIPNPIKHSQYFEYYRKMEKDLEAMIYERFGIKQETVEKFKFQVKQIDSRMLVTEMRDLMNTPPEPWEVSKQFKPYKTIIRPQVDPKWVENQYLFIFKSLSNILSLANRA